VIECSGIEELMEMKFCLREYRGVGKEGP